MADNTKTYIDITNKAIAFAEGALDPEIKSIVRKKAIWGGVFMAIPLYGIETIAYMFVLWSTYHKISDMSTVPFRKHFFQKCDRRFYY